MWEGEWDCGDAGTNIIYQQGVIRSTALTHLPHLRTPERAASEFHESKVKVILYESAFNRITMLILDPIIA